MIRGDQAEKALREVEKHYLDVFYQQYSILKRPRDTAIVHILRAFEMMSSVGSAYEMWRGNAPGALTGIMFDKEALRHALIWVSGGCPEGGDVNQDASDPIIEEASELLGFARKYALLWDVHVCIGHRLLYVQYDERQKRFRFHHRDELTAIPSLRSTVQRAEEQADCSVTDDENSQFFNVLAKAAKQVGPYKLEIDWNVVERAEVKRYVAAIMSSYPFELPKEWGLGGYSLSEYRVVWEAILGIALVSDRLHLLGCRLGVATTLCVDSCVPIFGASHWVDWIAGLSSQGTDTVAAIMEDLTYDSRLNNPDPSLQPFIPLMGRNLAFSVSCAATSNPERNLMKILNRKASKKQIYDELSQRKETIFINEVSTLLDSVGLRHVCRRELHEKGRRLTDVDILVWQKNTG